MRSLTEADRASFAALHPIFRDMADRDARRYDLATPWREGGYAYATDGRILVRTPLDDLDPEVRSVIPGRDDPGHGRRPKDPGSLFVAHGPHAAVPVALPDVCPTEPCPDCGGFGGEVLYREPPWEFFLCCLCEGELVMASQEPITLGKFADGEDYQVAAWMVGLLARHHALVYLPIDPETGLCREVGMRFTVGSSVEGVAMLLSRAGGRV